MAYIVMAYRLKFATAPNPAVIKSNIRWACKSNIRWACEQSIGVYRPTDTPATINSNVRRARSRTFDRPVLERSTGLFAHTAVFICVKLRGGGVKAILDSRRWNQAMWHSSETQSSTAAGVKVLLELSGGAMEWWQMQFTATPNPANAQEAQCATSTRYFGHNHTDRNYIGQGEIRMGLV